MPVYEYQCSACGHEFEEWQKINDKPVRKCPECGERKVERLMSRTSFQLKGSGWYVTEYGSKKGKESESPSTAKESDSSDSGKKTKTAADSNGSPDSGSKKSGSTKKSSGKTSAKTARA